MNAVHTLSLALALAMASTARADYLPDPAAAEAALWASSPVAQARGEYDAQTLRSASLKRGREEWTVGADALQRRIDAPQERYPEWGVAVSRPLRLPARAQADRALAKALTAHAEASLGEALHESGRQLLAAWFAWLGEASQAPLWRAQVQLAEQQLDAVNARIRLGEAPRADRVSAEAALAQVRLQQQQAAMREQQARSRLLAQFPGLPVQADLALPAPQAPGGTAEEYVGRVLEHDHELARARRQADMLQAEARQFASRRSVDPSIGVFYKNEMGGNEHLVGVSVGLTLPGPARRTDQEAAERLSTTAQEAARRMEQRLRQEAGANFEAAVAQAANWQQADRAAGALAEAARLAARAYGLGEGSLDQVLLNRRLALDGQLQAQQARLDALSAEARLRLDAHQLWPLDLGAEDGAHAHP
ncbi:TolC family protein [Thiobacillus sedimenti]|uniref:TolC family protein n=1 Tax=Thiobacillus sedimenti TaxID=3110231 RepID=A0ABZ1CNC4_9PROT|nr:TolC family protein [Thiobacillus sp. SCUT-2]WRS39453.1 TolC family protein [Thiobacillus sp. SCUT-2]